MSHQQVPGCDDIYAVDVPMFGTYAVNSPYVLTGPEPTIIDTGPADGVDILLESLAELGVSPGDVAYIVPTHAHLDHAGGAGHLAQQCENATVLCHERAMPYLTDDEKLTHLEESVERAIGMAAPYGEPVSIPSARCKPLAGGETITVGQHTLEVIDTPGHAPHHCCLYDPDADVLFAGDAVGMNFPEEGHRPTTPPPNFDLESWQSTLERLEALAPQTICYAHFGPGDIGTGVEEIRTYRSMLPEYVDQVARARRTHGDDVAAITLAVDDRWNHWSLSTDVAGILRYLDEREE